MRYRYVIWPVNAGFMLLELLRAEPVRRDGSGSNAIG